MNFATAEQSSADNTSPSLKKRQVKRELNRSVMPGVILAGGALDSTVRREALESKVEPDRC